MQTQIEDGFRLLFGEADLAVPDLRTRVGDQLHQRRHILGRPGLVAQLLTRGLRIGRAADQGDDLVDIGHGHRQTDQDVGAVARLAQIELGAADHHLLAVMDEGLKKDPQARLLRATADQRQHVDAERGLQRAPAVELVQDHLGVGVLFQLDHHAHARAVGFIAQIGDALDALVAHQLGDLLHHGGLVHLIGNLVNDDGFASLTDILDRGLGAQDDRAAAFQERLAGARPADDLAARGEVRRRHEFQKLGVGDVGLIEQRHGRVHHLVEVMGRDVGGHAHRDAPGAVDQQVRIARGQHDRLLLGAVIVVPELDRILVDIGQQRFSRVVHADFGVTHGCGRIAVHGAEIALAVHQGQAHGEGLRHPRQGVIDRAVAVRVIAAHHVADHVGGLLVRLVLAVAALMHGPQDAAVHRLQAVARIGNGAAHDHAHRVIEIAALHLVFDGHHRAARRGGKVFIHGRFRGQIAQSRFVLAGARPSPSRMRRAKRDVGRAQAGGHRRESPAHG